MTFLFCLTMDVLDKDNQLEDKRFPLRTFLIDDEIAEKMKNFLLEYDFIILMAIISFCTFTSTQILKIMIPPETHSNF